MTKKYPITKVFVDTKEQAMKNKSIAFFSGRKIPTQENANKDGDLVFILKNQEKVLIERKSFTDYVQSYIKNKHIQDQAIRLSEYNYYCCIVHGSIWDLQRIRGLNRIKQDSVDKMTINLMLFYKLPIFFVKDEKEYFKLSLLIAETVYKHHGKELEAISLGAGSRTRPDIAILAAQPNIGVQKAKMLLDAFGSPKAVLEASRKDLLAVKGVGDAMVASIQDLKDVYENGVEHD